MRFDTTHSLINNIIGQARNYQSMMRRLEKRQRTDDPVYDYEIVEMLTQDGYFETGPAERFAEAYIELLRTSTPTRKRKR